MSDSNPNAQQNDLSADYKQTFRATFEDHAPEGYDLQKDMLSATPWCSPWRWEKRAMWYKDNPVEAAQEWAKYCYEEVESELEDVHDDDSDDDDDDDDDDD